MKKPTGTRSDEFGHSLVDVAAIDQLAKIVSKYDLSEVEIDLGEFHVRLGARAAPPLRRLRPRTTLPRPAPSPAAPRAARAAVAGRAELAGAVKSPMVGTAYLRPSPEAKPFVEMGSVVKAGDKLLLVEAMKTFNDIVAPRGGKVVSILVDDGRRSNTASRSMVIE